MDNEFSDWGQNSSSKKLVQLIQFFSFCIGGNWKNTSNEGRQVPRTTVLDVLVVEDIGIYMDVTHAKKNMFMLIKYRHLLKNPLQNIHFHHTIILSGSKRHCANAS